MQPGIELNLDKYTSGEQFLEANKEYSIVFMDVEMPNIDGFTATRKYKLNHPDSEIAFLSSHREFMDMGYRVDAFRYIDKLKMREGIAEALDALAVKNTQDHYVEIDVVHGGSKSIKLRDIIYFETTGRNVTTHTYKGDIVIRNSLGQLEEDLKDYSFYRPHKSYLINLDWVDFATNDTITMQNGDKVCLTYKKHTEFKSLLFDRKFDVANQ